MNHSLRATTLEASRLAIEFDRAVATGNIYRIGNAAMSLEIALEKVSTEARKAHDDLLATYDHGRAKPFEGAGR